MHLLLLFIITKSLSRESKLMSVEKPDKETIEDGILHVRDPISVETHHLSFRWALWWWLIRQNIYIFCAFFLILGNKKLVKDTLYDSWRSSRIVIQQTLFWCTHFVSFPEVWSKTRQEEDRRLRIEGLSHFFFLSWFVSHKNHSLVPL